MKIFKNHQKLRFTFNKLTIWVKGGKWKKRKRINERSRFKNSKDNYICKEIIRLCSLKFPKPDCLSGFRDKRSHIGPLNNKQIKLLCSLLSKNSVTVTTSKIQPSSNKYPFTNETWTSSSTNLAWKVRKLFK